MKRQSFSFLAEAKNGQVIIDVRAWKQMVGELEGKEFVIDVETRGEGPSRAQVKFFHVICRAISDRTGIQPKLVKAALKNEFLLIDEEYELCRSITTLSTAEMSEFIENCLQWAAEKLELVIDSKQVAA